MRSFDVLVAEAEAAPVDGWGFAWLDGRATEERPGWGFAHLLAQRLADVPSALDIDTGGGEVIVQAPSLPTRMAVTEAWPPNLVRAREVLEPRGVDVVATRADEPLPFADASFALVSARHPVAPDWAEIHRVLIPGGRYFAQHVGPRSAAELSEYFVGPWPGVDRRDPRTEAAAARAAGLVVDSVRTARCRMEFLDIGAVVWVLRKCVWWVPDFTVDRYRDRLRALDAQLRAGTPFTAHSTRHLFEMHRPDQDSSSRRR